MLLIADEVIAAKGLVSACFPLSASIVTRLSFRHTARLRSRGLLAVIVTANDFNYSLHASDGTTEGRISIGDEQAGENVEHASLSEE